MPRANDPYLSSLKPKLREFSSHDVIEQALLGYEKTDNVPRVNKAISYILAHADKIFKEENYG